MAKRKGKMEIVFTTIKVAGYSDGKQMTNALKTEKKYIDGIIGSETQPKQQEEGQQ